MPLPRSFSLRSRLAIAFARAPFALLGVTLAALLAPATALATPETAPSPAALLAQAHVPVWHPLAQVAGLLVVAFLLNQVAPKKRRRLRPALLFLGLGLLAQGLGAALVALHAGDASVTAFWFADLLDLLVTVHLAGIVFFDLALLVVRYQPATIVADVAVGVAYLAAFLHTLHRSGVNLSGIVATSAVATGVLGISLAPTLGNILGGVALQLDDSISEGDWIQLDANTQGRVKSIRWRHTVVETRNWDTIIVPNATLLSGSITILGKRTDQPLQRRYWIYFNVDYRFSPSEVIAVVNEALQCSAIPNVAQEPKPHCICFDFARDGRDSMGYYAARYWLTDLAVDDPTNSAVRERIYAALQRAGMTLALPASAVFVTHEDKDHKERHATRERQKRIELLAGLELFRHFTPDELAHLADRLVYAPFARGEVMTLQGRSAHWLYILAKGEGEVTVKVDGGPPEHVGVVKAPDFFGEMAVMTGEPRTASVTATAPSECYRLSKDAFQKILTERKELASVVSMVLAQRRAELLAVRHHLDEEQKRAKLDHERERLLGVIQSFFGLTDDARPS